MERLFEDLKVSDFQELPLWHKDIVLDFQTRDLEFFFCYPLGNPLIPLLPTLYKYAKTRMQNMATFSCKRSPFVHIFFSNSYTFFFQTPIFI